MLTTSCFSQTEHLTIVETVDATHRPAEVFHLHAGIANYFHQDFSGQRFQKFGLQPIKWIKLSVSL